MYQRERRLLVLDAMGKFSLVDSYVLISSDERFANEIEGLANFFCFIFPNLVKFHVSIVQRIGSLDFEVLSIDLMNEEDYI
jgi:hypothetical protein